MNTADSVVCPECGGDCTPKDCGTHPLGCVFGGFSVGYWLKVDGCDRDHCDQHMDGRHINADCPNKATDAMNSVSEK
jgi:hypothetical protein